MILTIDIGNTNIVFAFYDDNGNLGHSFRHSSDTKKTEDEYAMFILNCMDDINIKKTSIYGISISSVVQQLTPCLTRMCKKYFGSINTTIVGENNLKLGVTLLTDYAQKSLGSDRIANCAGAIGRYGPDVIIVDFGTATTIDAVKNSEYVGGIILPGVNSLIESLYKNTSQLPWFVLKAPEKLIGSSTIDQLRSGVFHGMIEMIEGLLAKLKTDIGYNPIVVATGGISTIFENHFRSIDRYDSDLTTFGLYHIHKINTNTKN